MARRPMSFTGTRTGVLGSRGGVRVDARLVGGPQLAAALARLEKGMRDDLLQRATLAGGKVLEAEWKAQAASRIGLGPGTAHYVEAIEATARPGKRGATGLVRLGKEPTSEGEAQPVAYAMQLEFGGRGQPARPTLRPAFDSAKGDMLDAMSDELRALIEAAV
jgi:HK97 gp10 family phage protein